MKKWKKAFKHYISNNVEKSKKNRRKPPELKRAVW